MANIILDGETLDIEVLWKFCQQALDPKAKFTISIAKSARTKVKAGEDYLRRIAEGKETVYGVNTGFGFFARARIKANQIAELQENIIRSHSCGVGEELPRDLTLMMWLILLNSVCRGHRGLALSKLDQIVASLNAGMLSCVPARGSVGASGDLAPSAHAVLALLGEGDCTIPSGKGFARVPAAKALKKLKLSPLLLGPKEGLCLINGTQLTAAMAITAWNECRLLLDTANMTAAMSVEAMRGSHHLTDRDLLKEHRHAGTLACGKAIADWWQGATGISKSHEGCNRVQDPYSLRCSPQVHGAVWEDVQHAKKLLQEEINATTDNPTLFPDKNEVLHGGNFHAIYPARVCDRLASAMATLAVLSERRVNMAMKEDKSGLPNFLIKDGGLHSGFMMLQTTAAALASECKSLSFPASVDSIPTNNDQEDHVSMGPIAGVKALQIAKNLRYVLAIELLAAAQGLDLLAPLRTSKKLEAAKAKLRRSVPMLKKDRVLSKDTEVTAALIAAGTLLHS
ncbi:MAG: histidine ammonia-lyase [Alphaproteobacteria bacterium]|nr:histidine ammonia-lyase [Alphaproteobacteria bacterium]